MLQVVWGVRLLVYVSVFMTNRRALFLAICNLYLVGRIRELRRNVGYMRAGRMVVLYSLRLLCYSVGVDLKISSVSRDPDPPSFSFERLKIVTVSVKFQD